MKALKTFATVVIGLAVCSAQAGGILCVVDDVLNNSTESTITWKEQTYTIKPVEMVEKGKSAHTLEGTLEHRNGTAKAHRINYRVLKEKGAVKKIELQTDGGMWLPLSPEMTRAMGDFTKPGPIPDTKRNEYLAAMQKVADTDSWQKMAELIVAYVAVRHC